MPLPLLLPIAAWAAAGLAGAIALGGILSAIDAIRERLGKDAMAMKITTNMRSGNYNVVKVSAINSDKREIASNKDIGDLLSNDEASKLKVGKVYSLEN